MKALMWTALAALLSSGCAAARSTQAHARAREIAAERTGARVAWQSGSHDDERVQARVAALLGKELTTDAVVEIAMVRNPELLATFEDLGIAQADLVQAGLIDNLHIGGGPRFAPGGGVGWEGDAAVNVLQALLIPLRRKVAKAQLRDATLRVAQAILELDRDVRIAFVDAVAAEQALVLVRGSAELAEAAAELATRQTKAGGDGTMNELERGELVAAEAAARIELQEAQMSAIESRERLVRLLGLWGEQVSLRLPASLPAPPKADPDLADLERVAMRRRLDLQSVRAQVDGLADAVKLARRVPFVALQVGALGEADPGSGPTLGPFFELEVPIFDWGQAEIARAEATLRQVERRLQGMAIDARSEVRLSRARMVTERMLADYARDRVVPVRAEMVRLGQERYDAMLLGVYELIELKMHEYEAHVELVEHHRAYWTARAELELAVGGRLSRVNRKSNPAPREAPQESP
jgi:cobalt-zinc-cadmium efflux system outer membrane protein